MRIGTIVSLGASAALGLGALVVARVFLPAQSAHSSQAHAAPAVVAGTSVVVAAQAIGYGEKIEAKQLALVRMPADAAPPGAFTSIEQVLKLDGGGAPVALTPMSVREPLLPAKLSGPGARPTLAALISEGKRAYTIGVTDVAGGGGHVLPGDRVDVVLTRDLSGGTMEGARGGHLVSNVVLQSVRVLGMDLNVDPATTKPSVAHTATLEVAVEDAERLALAAQAGTLSLALRRAGSAEIQTVRPLTAAELTPSVGGPARRAGSARAGGARRPAASGAEMVIVQGATRASVAVPSERGV